MTPEVQETDFEPAKLPLLVWYLYSNPADKPFGGDTDIVLPKKSRNFSYQRIKPATFDKFQTTVRVPDGKGTTKQTSIFAFFGHGDTDPETKIGRLLFVKRGERNGWQWPWVSDPRASYAVKDTIGNQVRIAFLCACESAWAQTEGVFKNSIAGSLLKTAQSVGYIIGAQTPVNSFTADLFLTKVLELLPRLPIDLAMSEARVAVRAMDYTRPGQKYSPLDWWVPVLYCRAASLNLTQDELGDVGPQSPTPVATNAVIGLEAVAGELNHCPQWRSRPCAA